MRSSLDTMTPNQVLRDVMTNDTYRDDDEKEEKKEKKEDKKMRTRRVWHSRLVHHPSARARPSKTHQVKMKTHVLGMMKMMRRWISL